MTSLDEFPAALAWGGWRVTHLFWAAGLCVLAVAWFVFSYGYVEDDAFIHLEFARSVFEGRGFEFDGLLTNGDTAPLWVLLLSAIHALGLNWFACAKIACALGLVGTLGAILCLTHDLAGDDARRQRLALAATAVTVLNPFFVHWSFSGMESVTALGVSLWAIRATFVRPPTRSGLLGGAILLGVGPLLRPELLLLAGIGGPVVLWRCWQLERHTTAAVRCARMALLGTIMALPVVIWCIYAQLSFGSPIPNTNVAKRGGALAEIAPRLAAVYLVGFPVTLALLPFVVAGRLLRGPRIPKTAWILIVWPLLCIVFYLVDHTAVQTRYCLLSMPCLSIVTLWLIEEWDRPALFACSAGAMVLTALVTVWLIVVPHVENKKEGVRVFAQVGAFMRDHIPPQAPVAAFAIGEVAFESRHPLVDIGGITRPGVVPYMGDPRATLRWAKANGARYFMGSTDEPEPGAVPVFSATMPFFGWTVQRSLYRTTRPIVIYKLP